VLLAVGACLGSVYLGYILAVVLQDVCVVCISTYVVNAGLLLATLHNLRKHTHSKPKTA
jgi:vitamin-K-epoxide reductase (warfarin-sensitive)